MDTSNLTDKEFAEEFRKVLWDFDLSTRFTGWMKDIYADPNYQRVIDLSPRVIPLLLSDLKWSHRFWFRALEVLTGVDPVTDAHRGKIPEMIDDWLIWGKVNGYDFK